MQTKSDLGLYIRELRKEQNLTLHQVAVGVDIDSPMLSKIERGERLATIEQIKKLAYFFKIDENTLLAKLTAEKILKDYGANEVTLNAVSLVQEQLINYKKC
jgi:HTH-type transcriptional regulator, competence development regulator